MCTGESGLNVHKGVKKSVITCVNCIDAAGHQGRERSPTAESGKQRRIGMIKIIVLISFGCTLNLKPPVIIADE